MDYGYGTQASPLQSMLYRDRSRMRAPNQPTDTGMGGDASQQQQQGQGGLMADFMNSPLMQLLDPLGLLRYLMGSGPGHMGMGGVDSGGSSSAPPGGMAGGMGGGTPMGGGGMMGGGGGGGFGFGR